MEILKCEHFLRAVIGPVFQWDLFRCLTIISVPWPATLYRLVQLFSRKFYSMCEKKSSWPIYLEKMPNAEPYMVSFNVFVMVHLIGFPGGFIMEEGTWFEECTTDVHCRTQSNRQRVLMAPPHQGAPAPPFVHPRVYIPANHMAAYIRQHTNASSLLAICKFKVNY